MCSFMRVSTAWTATLIAFLIARGDDLPCEMMLTPVHAKQRRAAVLGVVELLERLPDALLGSTPALRAASRIISGAIAS